MKVGEDHDLVGYEAMGHPIPERRLSAAYKAVKEMRPDISTEDAMTLVGKVGEWLERDEPYKALREATHAPIAKDTSSPEPSYTPETTVHLDLIGGYRLFATLLAG